MIFNKSVFKNYSLKKITLKTVIRKLIKNNSVRFIIIDKKFNEIGSKYGIEDFKNLINK